MRPEDIYDGVTNIRDDLIENAKKPEKRHIWPAAIAAVLALAIALGGVAALRGRSDVTGDASGNMSGGKEATGRVVTLAEAVYPERPPYPETDEYGGPKDEEQYEAWWEDRRERQLMVEEREALTGWESRLLPALLSECGDENAVCSPVSVYLALGMLSEVTEGESRQQILDALGADSVEALRTQANRIWNAICNDNGTYTLDLASSVWLRDDFDYDTAPLQRLAESYYSSSFSGQMGSGKYNNKLRSWLNSHTGGLLEDAVEGVKLDADTALALATTVFFKDNWSHRFDPDMTDTGVFHAQSGDIEREFMHMNTFGYYFWSDKFAAVALGFRSGGAMYLLLPDEGVTADEILSDPAAVAFLTGTDAPDRVSSKYLKVDLSLPKFDVTQDSEIGERIRTLGITDVFDDSAADFSPIMGASHGTWLSKVLHAARVKIDEEGCVGAAYTVMAVNGSMMPPEETVEISFDRPFVFTVLNDGVTVFAGIVNEP